MGPILLAMALSGPAPWVDNSPRQAPSLPLGAQTRWVVTQPEEVVVYLAFDPAAVLRRLPTNLRFITLGELGAGGVGWAAEFLVKNPSKARWGVSFLEIIRTGTFTIDGHGPDWPEHGAVALWFARVAPSDPAVDLGPGRPFLNLDFWIPDKKYAAYMRGKGYHATYGEVRLQQGPTGKWLGSVKADGLRITTTFMPVGPVAGGAGSAGMQAIFPPRTSAVKAVVRVAFAGHREQTCGSDTIWTFQGAHPLARGIPLGPSSFQYGYSLIGGTYPP